MACFDKKSKKDGHVFVDLSNDDELNLIKKFIEKHPLIW